MKLMAQWKKGEESERLIDQEGYYAPPFAIQRWHCEDQKWYNVGEYEDRRLAEADFYNDMPHDSVRIAG